MSNENPTEVPHRRWPNSTPPATDYGVGMLPLTGRTLLIAGSKADGTPYVRTLANCSFVPGKGKAEHRIEGLDISVGEVRSFRLRLIETVRLRVGGPPILGADLVATMEHHIKNGVGPVTKVEAQDDGKVAA